MSAKSNKIRLTPLVGGKSVGGVCSLLEMGGFRLLLDCGCSSNIDFNALNKITKDLIDNGGIDAVLITHADTHHIGALPVLLGKLGLQNVPVICTLPVYKFGQIVLYDYFLNKQMEGEINVAKYDLDDIDFAFRKVHTVKYSQNYIISSKKFDLTTSSEISVCALPSGRTIGGAIWRIRCGPAEILYTMDVNLRKEVVLDGASLDLLPTGPALLIVEGAGAGLRKKKDRDENSALINSAMDTMRGGGNVLIPCETGGRILELMQLLGKHWMDNKLGGYHLIFLSHMARNVPEFGRMQLEWMSDTLSRSFYNGKPNPFELPQIKFVTSVREIEKKFPGPKVVFATDASLSCGLSKELLLKWGGDPRCKVIFTDVSDTGSLASELRGKYHNPPILSTVARPMRTELVGEELAENRREAEKMRKARDEAIQRQRRQEELSHLNAVQAGLQQDDEEEDDADGAVGGGGSSLLPARKRNKIGSSSAFARFAEPNVVMFERFEPSFGVVDDFGVGNEDLVFTDISTIDTRWQPKDKLFEIGGKPALLSVPAPVVVPVEIIPQLSEKEEVPWKLVSSQQRVQFTCEFRELSLGARADLKAVKTLITKVTPTRLVVLRGAPVDCDAVVSFAKSVGIAEAYAPLDGSTVAFQVLSEKLQVQIPQSLLPGAMKPMRIFSTQTSALADTTCTVSALAGQVLESVSHAEREGTRLMKYQGQAQAQGAAASSSTALAKTGSQEVNIIDEEEGGDAVDVAGLSSYDVNTQSLSLVDPFIGVVSVGEVQLNSLRLLIEATGTSVEFRLTAGGGILICGGQVVVRKDQVTNEFVLEGPPVPAFYEARKALYQQFAFV